MLARTRNIIFGVVGVVVVGVCAILGIRHFKAPTTAVEPETDPAASLTMDGATELYTFEWLDGSETLADLTTGTGTTVAGKVTTTKKKTTSTTKKKTTATTAAPGKIVNGATDSKGNEVSVAKDGSVGIVKPDGSIAASYSYDEEGNYFYTDSDPWQRSFGFNTTYDKGAAYVVMYYDTVRVKFRYNNLDWMIQMWKGQYGLLFIGSEIGLYYKPITKITEHYDCADDAKMLNMQMTLYRDGVSEALFTRPYAKHWWITGFVPGKLKKFADRTELKVVAKIEMKDEAMRKAFCSALDSEGFKYVANINVNNTESYTYRGNVVDFVWQYMDEDKKTNSDAATTSSATAAPTTVSPTPTASSSHVTTTGTPSAATTVAPATTAAPATAAPTTAAPATTAAAPVTEAPNDADY